MVVVRVLGAFAVLLCAAYSNEEFFSQVFDYYQGSREITTEHMTLSVVKDKKNAPQFEREVDGGYTQRWGAVNCVDGSSGGCDCQQTTEVEGPGAWVAVGFPSIPGEMSGEGVIGWVSGTGSPVAVQVDQNQRSGRSIARTMKGNEQTFVKNFKVSSLNGNTKQSVFRNYHIPDRACNNLGTVPQLWAAGVSPPRVSSITAGTPQPVVQGQVLSQHSRRGAVSVDLHSAHAELQTQITTAPWVRGLLFWAVTAAFLTILSAWEGLVCWARGADSFWNNLHFERVSVKLARNQSEPALTPVSSSQRAKRSVYLMDVGRKAAESTQCPVPDVYTPPGAGTIILKALFRGVDTVLNSPVFDCIAACFHSYIGTAEKVDSHSPMTNVEMTLFGQNGSLKTHSATMTPDDEKSFLTPRVSASRSLPHGLSQQEQQDESVDELGTLKTSQPQPSAEPKRTLQDYLAEYPSRTPSKPQSPCCAWGREADKYTGCRKMLYVIRNVIGPLFRALTLGTLLQHAILLILSYVPAIGSKDQHVTSGYMTMALYSMTILFPNRGDFWFEWQTLHRAAGRLALAMVVVHFFTNKLKLSPFGLSAMIALFFTAAITLVRTWYYSQFLLIHVSGALFAQLFIGLHQPTQATVYIIGPSVLIRILSYSSVCLRKQAVNAVVLAQGDSTFVHSHNDIQCQGKMFGKVKQMSTSSSQHIELPRTARPTMPAPYCLVTLEPVTKREKPFTLITGGLIPTSTINNLPIGFLHSSKVDVPSNLSANQSVSLKYVFHGSKVANMDTQGSVFGLSEGLLTRTLLRRAIKLIFIYKDNIVSISQQKQVLLRGEIHHTFLPGFTFSLDALASLLYHVLAKEDDSSLPLRSETHLVGAGLGLLQSKCSCNQFLIKATNQSHTAPSRIHALHEPVTIHRFLGGSTATARLWSVGVRNRYDARSARHEHTVNLHSCTETAHQFPELAHPSSASSVAFVGSELPIRIGTQSWQSHDPIQRQDNVFLLATGAGITPILGMIERCAAAMGIARGQAEEQQFRQWQTYVCLKSSSVDYANSAMDCLLDQADLFSLQSRTYITNYGGHSTLPPVQASAHWLNKRVMVAWYCADLHLVAYIVEKLASLAVSAYTSRDAIVLGGHEGHLIHEEAWNTHCLHNIHLPHQHHAVNSVFCGPRHDSLEDDLQNENLSSVQYGQGMIHVEIYYTGPHHEVLAGVSESQHNRETRVHPHYAQASAIARKASIHKHSPSNKTGGLHVVLSKPSIETAFQAMVPTVLSVREEALSALHDESELHRHPILWTPTKMHAAAKDQVDPLVWLRHSLIQPPICLGHALVVPQVEISSVSATQWLNEHQKACDSLIAPKLYSLPSTAEQASPTQMAQAALHGSCLPGLAVCEHRGSPSVYAFACGNLDMVENLYRQCRAVGISLNVEQFIL